MGTGYINIEGDDTWRQNHEAMVVLRWNLFNGGQDQSGVNTAVAKNYESRLNRTDNLAALQDTVRAAWAAYCSLCDQEDIYHEAALSGKETLTAYMQQFSVSRRSLVDVLNAEREFVQAAQRAVSARIDRVIAAYFILQLEGELKLDRVSTNIQGRQEFEELLQSIEFPAVGEILVNPQIITPAQPFNIVHIHGLVVTTDSSRKNWSPKRRQPLAQRTFLQLRPPIIASTMDNSPI